MGPRGALIRPPTEGVHNYFDKVRFRKIDNYRSNSTRLTPTVTTRTKSMIIETVGLAHKIRDFVFLF